LRNFGVFDVRITKSRVGRNPRKPEVDLVIPARATVKFRAGGELKEAVLKLSPKRKKQRA
jgi:DNA-binding protein HU-beta/integration host factor subunit alpha